MTKKRVVLIVVAVLLAVVIGVLLVMDSRLKVLFSSPRVSHEVVVSESGTRGVLAVDIQKAGPLIGLIGRKIPGKLGLALPMALPYEAALVADVDLFLGDVGLKFFINDRRLAPVILKFSQEQLKLPAPYDEWFKEPMRQERRGVLLLEGKAKCGRDLRDMIGQQWKDAEVDKPLRIEGGHFIEGVLDNRDGSALAIASVICESQGKPLNVDETVLGFLAGVSDYRLQADWVSENELAVRVLVDCSAEGLPAFLQSLLDGALSRPDIKENAKRMGIMYQGGVTAEGNTVVAAYRVNVEKLLARL